MNVDRLKTSQSSCQYFHYKASRSAMANHKREPVCMTQGLVFTSTPGTLPCPLSEAHGSTYALGFYFCVSTVRISLVTYKKKKIGKSIPMHTLKLKITVT